MKLIKCHIENFGKLSNFDFDFSGGLNVIKQENGFGKTTFATFIKSMFYGLPSTTKRNLDENERKKYKPWQGGNYGGNIEFVVSGKTYKIQRFFGKNSSEDSFELYDTKTGKKSQDFTQNIGEELFKLDADAFERSVFVPQKALSAGINESISNKLADTIQGSTEQFNLEKALELLNEKRVRLYNNKSTGEIQELEFDIDDLELKIQDLLATAGQIDILSEKVKQNDAEIVNNQKSLDEINNQIKDYSESQRVIANKHLYDKLTSQIQELEIQEKNAKSVLNNAKITPEMLETQIKNSQELEKMQNVLNAKKSQSYLNQKYEELNQYFKNDVPSNEKIESINKDIDKYNQLNTSTVVNSGVNKHNKLATIILLLLAGLSVVLGVVFVKANPSISIIGFVLGVAIIFVCGFLYLKNMINLKQTYFNAQGNQICADLKSEIEDFIYKYETEQNYIRAISSIRAKKLEYDEVLRQNQLYAQELKELEGKIEKISNELVHFLNMFNIENKLQSVQEKLLIIKHYYDDLNITNQKLEKERAELAGLCENFDVNQVCDIRADNIVDLQKKQSDLQSQIDAIKDIRASQIAKIETIQNGLDVLNELENQKDEKTQKLTMLKKQLTAVKNAKKFLEDANESLSSKFLQPMKDGLIKYLNIITSNKYDNLQLDTDFNVAFEEYGKIREIDFYSKGYKDIMGLCMRFALIDTLFDSEKPFVVLDDPFVNFDEMKIKNIKDFLNKIAKEYQIIYFVCHTSRC